MKTFRLTNLYDRLGVWERIPLLLAARTRGDEEEARRLFNTAPYRTWWLPNHLLAEQALHMLAVEYVAHQLDAAVQHFFALLQMFCEAEKVEEDDDDVDWLAAAKTQAYFFTINAEAWRLFCAELGVSPEALTADNHHGWILSYCEEHMPAQAPSAEELLALLRQAGKEATHLVTADDLLHQRRDLLRAMTSHAPPRFPKEEA